MIADTEIVVLSDMHSGGSTALFPNRFWQFANQNHTPTKHQKKMFAHYELCAAYGLERRRGRRLIVIHDGDAIEGYHHNTQQTLTQNKQEQAEVHCELMDYFLERVKFGRGDELYYVNGTETHTGQYEEKIAEDMGAKRNPAGGHVFEHLELTINGKLFWFAHHGAGAGAGANEGNGLRNFLRNVYYDCLKIGATPPDCIVTGHVHKPTWNTYIAHEPDDFRVMHGIICPSWQMKTRYGYKAAPVQTTEIGAVFISVPVAGDIPKPKLLRMATDKV